MFSHVNLMSISYGLWYSLDSTYLSQHVLASHWSWLLNSIHLKWELVMVCMAGYHQIFPTLASVMLLHYVLEVIDVVHWWLSLWIGNIHYRSWSWHQLNLVHGYSQSNCWKASTCTVLLICVWGDPHRVWSLLVMCMYCCWQAKCGIEGRQSPPYPGLSQDWCFTYVMNTWTKSPLVIRYPFINKSTCYLNTAV